MIELPVTLTSTGGAVSFASPVPLGYTKNKGVYRLLVNAEGEWEGLTIRCFWHLPGGTDPASSLVQDGAVDVPASVTAHPGNGCITFEGSDGVKTVTSADLRYRVGSNSGTEDGTMPEPGTPAWEQLVSETAVALEAVQKQIGNLDDLTTKAKETLVAAINEAVRTGSGGAPGADGYSPTASVEQSTDGAKITITDKSGTTEAVVKNGANGRDGADGKDGAGMDITGATVGQIAKISAVDENGKPTAWEPVDMAIGRNAELPLIYDFTTSEEARWIDTGGTAFSCAQEFIVELTAVATETNTSDNNGCASIYTASTSIGKPWTNNFMGGIDGMLPKKYSRYFVAHGRKGSGGGWLVDFAIRTIVNTGKVQVHRTFGISGVWAETITGIIIGDASAQSGTRVLGAGTRLRIFGV